MWQDFNNNADDLMTVFFFLSKQIFLKGKFTDPAFIPSII